MLEKSYDLNILLQVIKTVIFSIQLFLFNVNFTEYFERLAGVYNIYSMVFTMEILLSLLVTVTTAINLLKDTVINAFKLINVNRSNNIDIILGDNEIELNYAKTSSNAIVWLSDASRSKVNDLIEEGYTVINKKLTVDVLKSKLFNKNKEYHFVAFNDEKDDKFIKYIEIIKDYILTTGLRNIYLHIEMRYEELETIRNEIISKNKIEGYTSMKKLELPSTLETIGKNAFNFDKKLSTITLSIIAVICPFIVATKCPLGAILENSPTVILSKQIFGYLLSK